VKSEHDVIVQNYQNEILTLKEKRLKKQENDLEVILKLKKENERLKDELIDYKNIKNELIKYDVLDDFDKDGANNLPNTNKDYVGDLEDDRHPPLQTSTGIRRFVPQGFSFNKNVTNVYETMPDNKLDVQKDDEIDDPLDAFMLDIDSQVQKESQSKSIQEKIRRDDIEDEDFVKSYVNHMKKKGIENVNSDEEVINNKKYINYRYNSDDNPVVEQKRKDIEPLQVIEIEKFFYEEHPDIAELSDERVKKIRRELDMHVSGADVAKPGISFVHFGFDEALLNVVIKHGYSEPTEIQKQAVPVAMSGRDIIGSSKTAAFIWPMLTHVMDQEELQKAVYGGASKNGSIQGTPTWWNRDTNQRKEIIDEVNNKQNSIRSVAAKLRISRSTVHDIVKQFDMEDQVVLKPKGGDKRSILTEELKDFLSKITIPHKCNTSDTILDRKRYVEKIHQKVIDMLEDAIYIDETGFNLHLSSSHGCSLRGQPAVQVVETQRGKNITVIAAINKNGVLNYIAYLGSANADTFAKFIQELIFLVPTNKKKFLIIDNAKIHRAYIVKDIVEDSSHEIFYLPPYLPFLNPIESTFSKVKDLVAQNKIRDHETILSRIADAFDAVSEEDCLGWIRHTMTYFDRCLNQEEIDV
ncbi:11995_t:CDS:10, partial [Cetraspora pellucida]